MPKLAAGFSAPFLVGDAPPAVAEPDGGVRLWGLRGTAAAPRGGAGQDPWNAWRHRHGYIRTSAGYRWNTLGNHPETLPPDLGAVFDENLQKVWRHWALEPATAPAAAEDRVDVELSVPGPARYALNLWGARLAAALDIARGNGDWLMDLAEPPRWELDRVEWRRRHLYGPGDTRLDGLMARCAAYWAEATAHLLLVDLDAKLRQAGFRRQSRM